MLRKAMTAPTAVAALGTVAHSAANACGGFGATVVASMAADFTAASAAATSRSASDSITAATATPRSVTPDAGDFRAEYGRNRAITAVTALPKGVCGT
jgi:hypothetical protein